MSDEPLPHSEIILYQTEEGRTRVQCRFENETVWLTQALIAELFEKDVRTINEHLVNIFDEGEPISLGIRRQTVPRPEGVQPGTGIRRGRFHQPHDPQDGMAMNKTLKDILSPKP